MALVWFCEKKNIYLEMFAGVCVWGGGGAAYWGTIPSKKKIFLHFLVSTDMYLGITSLSL